MAWNGLRLNLAVAQSAGTAGTLTLGIQAAASKLLRLMRIQGALVFNGTTSAGAEVGYNLCRFSGAADPDDPTSARVTGDHNTFTGVAGDKIDVTIDSVAHTIDLATPTTIALVAAAINAQFPGRASVVGGFLRIQSSTTGTSSNVTLADGTGGNGGEAARLITTAGNRTNTGVAVGVWSAVDPAYTPAGLAWYAQAPTTAPGLILPSSTIGNGLASVGVSAFNGSQVAFDWDFRDDPVYVAGAGAGLGLSLAQTAINKTYLHGTIWLQEQG